MKQYGLIGYPLGHSRSPELFEKIWERDAVNNCSYQLYPLEKIEELPGLLLSNPALAGLNVTIPYKAEVLPFCTEISDAVRQIGAANTLKISRTSGGLKIAAFNTDIIGFEKSLIGWIPNFNGRALILGNGGAAKAVSFVLENMQIPFQTVSRKAGGISVPWAELNKVILERHKLIINTTPLGMYPNIEECPPLLWNSISGEHFLYDLVYNPELTQFMQCGLQRGAEVKNGLEMLQLQAEAAWEIWNS